MNTTHIVMRLRQLAAWYDPATKERPNQFPYGVHEYCRTAADRILALEGALAINEAELFKAQQACYARTAPEVAHLSPQRISEIAAQYVLPAQTLAFTHAIERELNGLREQRS